MSSSSNNLKPHSLNDFALNSFSTALVLLPPPMIQSRVNVVRTANDKSYPRWTSHITLMFPFVQPDNLDTAITSIQQAVLKAQLNPFSLQLDTTGQFRGRGYDTVYLSPSSVGCEELNRLWAVLTETLGYSGRAFVPHMTLGQAYRKEDAALLHSKGQRLVQREPLLWTVSSIVCLCKDDSAEGRMRIFKEISLSSQSPTARSVIAPETSLTFHFDSHENSWLATLPSLVQYDAVRELSIVTYNVLHDHNHPSLLRSEEMLAALSEIDADIICLQEVTDELLSLFLAGRAIRSRWRWCNRGPDAAMESERNIVIFSKENLPFSWQRVVLGGKHKAAMIASLHFLHPTAGNPRTMVVAAIHLTAGLLPEQLSVKSNEFQTLVQYLQQRHGNDDWIIIGDTNLPEAHGPFPLIDHACTDAWIAHHGASGMGYDATYDPSRNKLAEKTARQDKSPQRYDRIYIKKTGALQVSAISVAENISCSDHWPLHARLTMQSPVIQTLPTTHVELSVPSRKDDGALISRLEDQTPDTDLWKFAESSGAIPPAERVQQKERVIHTLCRTLGASRDGSAMAGFAHGDSSQDDAQVLNSVRLVLVPVGSFALGVDFPDSDLDCIVVGNVSSSSFWAISRQEMFSQQKDGDQSSLVTLRRFVKDAAVQMMVLEVDGVKVDLQYCPSAGLAESWPSPAVFLDQSFTPSLNVASMRVLNAHRDRIRLANEIPNLPSFQLAFRSVKLYCIHHGLYSARFGYLGGIHIAILLTKIASRMPTNATATDLVRRFFNDYAAFDWAEQSAMAVSINSTYRRTIREPMVILSAERPIVNVAANSTILNVKVIAEEFKCADRQLTSNVSWSNICGIRKVLVDDFLRQFSAFIKLQVSHWGGNCMAARALVGFVESRLVHLLVDIHAADPGLYARLWPERFADSGNDKGERSTLDGFYLIGLVHPAEARSGKPLLSATQLFEEYVRKNVKYYDPAVAFVSVYECSREELGNCGALDSSKWSDGGVDELTEDDDDDIADAASEIDIVEPSVYKSNAALKKKKTQKSESAAHTPAPKLRTSADVFNRLMWDPQYDASNYLIGYEDRFEGVKEMPLKNWSRQVEDEAFVPFHRVVHFRIKSTGEKVWDRKSKLDKVFGSGRQT